MLHLTILCILLLRTIGAVDPDNTGFKPSYHRLLGSKTLYCDARQFVDLLRGRPNSFDDDSLEGRHFKLLSANCEPIVFFFFSRHSARFPEGNDADVYNKHMIQIQDALRQHVNTSSSPDKVAELLNWKPKMQLEHESLITHAGSLEQQDIARRFKKLYPEFFNAKRSDVRLGVTTYLRTAQTAVEFLKEVDDLDLGPDCANSFPIHDLDHQQYSSDGLRSHPCYEELMSKYVKRELSFDEECKAISGIKKFKYPLVERARNPKVVQGIIDNISSRLGFTKLNSPIDIVILNDMYDNCRFETALLEDSIWCKLFTEDELKVLEYIEDVNTYIKGAYGHEARPKQSCPVVKDLLETFLSATEEIGDAGPKKRSVFYFSHATPMKKMLAAFGLFEDSESFSEAAISEFERHLKVPENRNWRISGICPFSANMAFILYRCQVPGTDLVEHKVLSTVTEQPVHLSGCKETVCDSRTFFTQYDSFRDCDLKKICAKRKQN